MHAPLQRGEAEAHWGMLLGFIVSEHGIKANPEKILAIMRMGLIQNMKGV